MANWLLPRPLRTAPSRFRSYSPPLRYSISKPTDWCSALVDPQLPTAPPPSLGVPIPYQRLSGPAPTVFATWYVASFSRLWSLSFLVFLAKLCQNVEVPGGQQIYIAPNGAVSFTQAHSGYVPPDSLFDGFSVDQDGKLFFAGFGFYSCPPADQTSDYQLYAAAHNPSTDECVVVQLFTSTNIGAGFGAWQYV